MISMPAYAKLMTCTTRWMIFTQSCSSQEIGNGAGIGLTHSTRNAVETRDLHGRDDWSKVWAVDPAGRNLSRLHSRSSGMGKTSVSLAVVELPLIKERFPDRNVVWLPCIEATSATLLLEILSVQLQVPGDKEVTLEKIISELDNLKQPVLSWSTTLRRPGMEIRSRLAIFFVDWPC